MRNLSAPLDGSGASTIRRYKLAMVLWRASDTSSASAMRSTCRHCGWVRRRCKPHRKASNGGEWCTMSLSKRISFLRYALACHPERTRIFSCVQFGPYSEVARVQYSRDGQPYVDGVEWLVIPD